jgi:hypothetical protein
MRWETMRKEQIAKRRKEFEERQSRLRRDRTQAIVGTIKLIVAVGLFLAIALPTC